MFIVIFVIIVAAVVFHSLHQQGVLRLWKGPNNNLGCLPILLVFILTIWLITQIPVGK